MSEEVARCHALFTYLVLWSHSTEWNVEYRDGKYIATTDDPDQFAPPAAKSFAEAQTMWSEWFKCQRG